MTDTIELTTPVLGPAQVEAYRQTGFALLRQAFAPAAMARVADWADALARLPERRGAHWVYGEPSKLEPGRRLISRIERIAPFHAGFRALAAALCLPMEQLLGEPAVLFKEKINYKMPGGDGFRPHQDVQAGWDRYASRFVTVALALDAADIANGCLWIAPGQHRRGMFKSWEPLGDGDLAGMSFEPVPTAPGDLVLIDGFAPHRSEPNLTAEIRRMYFATYNPVSAGDQHERYYRDKRRSYPPDIEREPGKEYVFRV